MAKVWNVSSLRIENTMLCYECSRKNSSTGHHQHEHNNLGQSFLKIKEKKKQYLAPIHNI